MKILTTRTSRMKMMTMDSKVRLSRMREFVELHLRSVDANSGLPFEVLLDNDDGEEDDNEDQNDQEADDDESAQRILDLIRCKYCPSAFTREEN